MPELNVELIKNIRSVKSKTKAHSLSSASDRN